MRGYLCIHHLVLQRSGRAKCVLLEDTVSAYLLMDLSIHFCLLYLLKYLRD